MNLEMIFCCCCCSIFYIHIYVYHLTTELIFKVFYFFNNNSCCYPVLYPYLIVDRTKLREKYTKSSYFKNQLRTNICCFGYVCMDVNPHFPKACPKSHVDVFLQRLQVEVSLKLPPKYTKQSKTRLKKNVHLLF
jgi:hypothetical protein